MTDKERLEELINRKPNRWGNLTIYGFEKDIKILQEQAKGIQELVHQNKRYREALEFYADRENYKPDHYDPNTHEYMSVIDYDEGATARKALEGDE